MTLIRVARNLARLGILLVLAAQLDAYAAMPPDQASAPAPVPVGTRVVPVLVTGGGGTPAAGLTQGDFSLTVNASPQAITLFQEVAPAVSEWKPAATGSNQFTNAQAAHEPQRATAIVLDTIHTEAADEAGVRGQILKYLADAASRREMVAVFVLSDRGLELVHDLRLAPSLFDEVMKQVGADSGKKGSYKMLPVTPVGAGRDRQIADEVARLTAFAHGYQSNPAPINTQPRGNIELPLQAWAVLAQYLGGINGRKSVLWLTARMSIEIDTGSGALIPPSTIAGASTINGQSVSGGRVNTISDADLKKYEIKWERAIQALQQNEVAITVLEIRPAGTAASQTQATMESLTEMTGGRLYWAANDMHAAIADASQIFSHYYRLGYTLTASGSGAWLKQSVKTKGDARVVAPNGFFNTPTATNLASTRQGDFDNSFQVPVDQTAVPFVVQVGEGAAAGGKKRVPLAFLMPGGSFAIDQANQNKVALDFAAAAFDSKGGVGGQYSSSINTNLPEGAVAQILANGTSVKADMDIAPGDYTLRCVVRDDLTGKVGSFSLPLSVK